MEARHYVGVFRDERTSFDQRTTQAAISGNVIQSVSRL
jgi:hypothetical protein